MEEGFLRQLELLPAETRKLLLTAAVEPVGDVAVLWRAVGRLGIGSRAAAPAESAGLIEFGMRVRFRHVLVRSAAWRAASTEDLREVHGALSEVRELDVDRRVWHRAQASTGPDAETAAELERSAGRARARGGFAAAAAFLERAAELTPEAGQRIARLLAAAQTRLRAGEVDAALHLLGAAEASPLDAFARARIDLLRAQAVFASSHSTDAPPLLLAAAKRLEPLDGALARDTYLDAFSAAVFAGRLAETADVREVARAAPRAPTAGSAIGDVLLEGLSSLVTDGYSAAVPVARRALEALRAEEPSGPDGLRWLWLASVISAGVWDDETWQVLSTRHVTLARDAGAQSELLLALHSRVVLQLFVGDVADAQLLVDEADAVRGATDSRVTPYGAMALAAWQGREEPARSIIEAALSEATARGEGIGITVAQWSAALLHNGLGRYEDALAAARVAGEFPSELAAANWGLSELVEAAARSGAVDEASEALERLAEMAQASRTDWALGVEARSRALLSQGDAAEKLYREGIERLGRTRCRAELGRTRLLFGEWLRREGRRVDAREHLRSAHDLFSSLGAEGFGERARRELAATGGTTRARPPGSRDSLTAQEAQIARLAASRRTNTEIGAQLFISPRTVEWHLRKVFTKLAVSSRRELAEALSAG